VGFVPVSVIPSCCGDQFERSISAGYGRRSASIKLDSPAFFVAAFRVATVQGQLGSNKNPGPTDAGERY